MMIFNLYFARDIIKNVISSKEFKENLISSILGCVGIILICWMTDIGWHNWIPKIIFSVILSVGIYTSILVFFKNTTILSVMNKLKSKVLQR